MYNHIDGINQVATKCQLHKNMEAYAAKIASSLTNEGSKSLMPETYIMELPERVTYKYISTNADFKAFKKAFTPGSWWIIKPGEDANRGHGIKVFDNLNKIQNCLTNEFNRGPKVYKTCII